MWETIKNDPILKTITILILGVLGFGFAFNIMFGPNTGGMGSDDMMMAGVNYNNFGLVFIFVLAMKLFISGLIILAVLAVLRVLFKFLKYGGETNMNDTNRNDGLFRLISIVIIAIISLGVISSVFWIWAWLWI